MKKIILFDIDHTLFDTDIFYKYLAKKLTRITRTTPKKFQKISRQYFESLDYSNDFNLDNYLKHVAEFFNLTPKILIGSVYRDSQIYKESLFKDTIWLYQLKCINTRWNRFVNCYLLFLQM